MVQTTHSQKSCSIQMGERDRMGKKKKTHTHSESIICSQSNKSSQTHWMHHSIYPLHRHGDRSIMMMMTESGISNHWNNAKYRYKTPLFIAHQMIHFFLTSNKNTNHQINHKSNPLNSWSNWGCWAMKVLTFIVNQNVDQWMQSNEWWFPFHPHINGMILIFRIILGLSANINSL